MGFPVRLCFKLVVLLVAVTVRFSEMKVLPKAIPSLSTVLVGSYYQSMKNAKVQSNKSTTIRLYSRSLSSFVRITAANTIDARQSNQKSDPDTLIQLELLGPRRVLIKSKTHGTYVCFNKKNSDVVIKKKNMGAECVFFRQKDRKNYVMFQSAYNNTWYLGISQRKNGSPKSGRKTSIKQRSIKFVET